MKQLIILLVLTIGLALPAYADIWKWVDANGKSHFAPSVALAAAAQSAGPVVSGATIS